MTENIKSCPQVCEALARHPDLPQWVQRALLLAPQDAKPDVWFSGLEDLEQDLRSGTTLAYSGDCCDAIQAVLSDLDLQTWLCTDTQVGLRAVLLRGSIVGLSFQPARKSDMQFIWFKPEYAQELRAFLRQLEDSLREDPRDDVVSDDPGGEWVAVKRILMRPAVPDPIILDLGNPATGQVEQVDVSRITSDCKATIRLIVSMTPEELQGIDLTATAGATPGEEFAIYSKAVGPIKAGAAYFGES
jgi:hypothetical protein